MRHAWSPGPGQINPAAFASKGGKGLHILLRSQRGTGPPLVQGRVPCNVPWSRSQGQRNLDQPGVNTLSARFPGIPAGNPPHATSAPPSKTPPHPQHPWPPPAPSRRMRRGIVGPADEAQYHQAPTRRSDGQGEPAGTGPGRRRRRNRRRAGAAPPGRESTPDQQAPPRSQGPGR